MRNYILILLLSLVTTTSAAQTESVFEITDIFNISGRGTVFVGSLEDGSFRVNDEVDLLKPNGSVAGKVTIVGIEQFRRSVQTADKIGEQYGFRVNVTANTEPAEKGDQLVRKGNSSNQNFVFAGENAFSVTGKGTVLAGTIISGSIAVNDQVDIIGMNYDRKNRIATEILKNQQAVSSAGSGEFVGVVLRGINTQEVDRGTVLATPGTVEQTNIIRVQFTFQEDVSIPDETLFLYGSYVLNVDTRVQILQAGNPQVILSGSQRELFLASDRPIIVKIGETVYLRKGGRRLAEGTVTVIGIP